jgi:hypothetical protein
LVAILLEQPRGMSELFAAKLRYEKAYRRHLAHERTLTGVRALRVAYRARNQ